MDFVTFVPKQEILDIQDRSISTPDLENVNPNTVQWLLNNGILKTDPQASVSYITIKEKLSPKPIEPLFPDSISTYTSSGFSAINPSSDAPQPASIGSQNPYLDSDGILQAMAVLRQIFIMQIEMEKAESTFSQKIIENIIQSTKTKQDAIEQRLQGEILTNYATLISASAAIALYAVSSVNIIAGIKGQFDIKKPLKDIDKEYKSLTSTNKIPDYKSKFEVKMADYDRQKQRMSLLTDYEITGLLMGAVDHMADSIKSGMSIAGSKVTTQGRMMETLIDAQQSLSFKLLDSSNDQYDQNQKQMDTLLGLVIKISSMSSKLTAYTLRA